MSTSSRRRVRQRLSEIHFREEDGMSRPWMDNLPSKDIKDRPKVRPQGQPMKTEGMADEFAAAKGKTDELQAAIDKTKNDSAQRGDPPFRKG